MRRKLNHTSCWAKLVFEHLKTLSSVSQAFELRLWDHQHPLRQFGAALQPELLFKMEDRGLMLDQLQVHGLCNLNVSGLANMWFF